MTLQDMQDMVRNYAQFSTGANPYYRPFISLNHDDALNVGFVNGCRLDNNGIMRLDAVDVPAPIGAWANAKRLQAPSIEYWRPKWEGGKLVGSFMKPDGTYADTPVLKCLTLLGNDAPAVKGLGPLPVAKFSNSSTTHRFGANAMDRAAMLSTLQGMGFDVSKITDQVPDEVLQAIMAFIQSQAQPGGGAPTATVDPTAAAAAPSAMADKDKDKDGNPVMCADLTTPVAALPTAGSPTPSAITLKFNDNAGRPMMVTMPVPAALAGMVQQNNAILQQINARGQAVAADLKRQRDASKHSAIALFCDRMKGRYTPAQLAAYRLTLVHLDHDNVRKFADGKAQGTALEEAIAAHEAAAGPVRVDREQIKQPMNGTPGASGGMDEARRAKILAADPMFTTVRKAK